MGSGTTGAIAKKLGRNFIGIEKEDKYIKFANERIEKAKPYVHDTLTYPFEAKKPKVPFGNLIENDFIKVGEYLYSKDKKHKAKVLANATLISNDKSGSIHRLSAELLGKTSNNGWTFWYVEKNNNLKSIDELREEYTSKYITLRGK